MNTQVYVGMGGNIGDTVSILNQALDAIANLDQVTELRCSDYYRTTPVGIAEQPDYVNGVCAFRTTLAPQQLHRELRRVETELGKVAKPKNHPRVIDLDLLFYGSGNFQDKDLIIPHPHWSQRLFVLMPLLDLTHEIILEGQQIDLKEVINNFFNVHEETVTFLEKPAILSERV